MSPDCQSVNSSYTISYKATGKNGLALPGFVQFIPDTQEFNIKDS